MRSAQRGLPFGLVARNKCMTEVLKRKFVTAPFLVGTLLLLSALTFYYFAVLKVDYSKTALLDLGPGPDAMEYFALGLATALLGVADGCNIVAVKP